MQTMRATIIYNLQFTLLRCCFLLAIGKSTNTYLWFPILLNYLILLMLRQFYTRRSSSW